MGSKYYNHVTNHGKFTEAILEYFIQFISEQNF